MTGTVHDGNPKFANAPFDEQIRLAEASFKTVLDANLHEDDKAGRILGAMAFLTTAAAVIFNVAYSQGPSTTSLKQTLQMILQSHLSNAQLLSEVNGVVNGLQQPSQTIFGLNISVLALSVYIFFVLVGSALYLGALGPSLNKPSRVDPSLLFFYYIAQEKKWSENWQNRTIKSLQWDMVQNYIDECQLIAQKVNAKVTLMTWGSICFRVALLSFIFLMATLFLPNSVIFWVFLLFGLFSILASLLFVYLKQPSQSQKKLLLLLQKLRSQIGQSAAQKDDTQSTTQEGSVQSAAQQGDKDKVP